MKLESLLIHGGIEGDERTGAVNIPIYQTSTYKQSVFGKHASYEYSRTGNPTRDAIEKLIADIEGGTHGFAFASGLAAITAILTLFSHEDKILITNNLYGGTFRLLDKIFKNFNINYEIIDDFDLVENHIDQNTKAIFIESPTNPLLDVVDIKKVAEIAKRNNLLTIVDNTFMTPYFQNPLSLGADIVIHSGTKYLGGHSDLVAGLVVVNNADLAEKLHFIQNATGGILQPFDSFLLIRGIKTLAVRMDKHEENSIYISKKLALNKSIDKVYYPGLKEHPGHLVQKLQSRGFGGVITFRLNESVDYVKFINSLELITFGESLGGVESLLCHPLTMTHAALPEDLRKRLGINERLIRLSVGIENKEDILNDVERAIALALSKEGE